MAWMRIGRRRRMNWESPLKIKMRPSGNATNRFALEDNLGGLGANIGDHLADQGAHDALLGRASVFEAVQTALR